MTFWRTFHLINEDLAFAFGFSLNVLLLIVIKKVEVKAIQKYNILLFQCCCIDLLQVVISFIVKPVIVIHKKSEYFLSNGFLRPIGGWIEMLGIVSWATSVFFCINSMPVSYIFRYRTVCLNAIVSTKFYVISLIAAALSSSTFGIIVWKFHFLDNRHMAYLAETNFPWLMADDEGKVKAASVCFAGSFGIWLTIVDAFFVTFTPYAIMIVCNIKILKYLKHHQHSLSPAARRVQADLNKILLAQAVIPIFSAFLPMTIHLLSALTDFDLVFATFICGILYSWIPVGNAISVLFFVTAYRMKLKQLVFRFKPQLPRFMSASTTQLVFIDRDHPMTFWRTFHSIHEDVAFFFGFSLNILLLVVIKKIKVKCMQKYNILLFQCCCVDMFQVVISFIVKPIIVIHHRNVYFLSNGFLRPIGGRIEMLGIVLWAISVFFCINSMPVSFIFRYRTVCLNAIISKKFYVISLVTAFLSASTYGAAIWKFHYLDNHYLTYMAEEGFSWLMADDQGKVKAASVSPVGTLGMFISVTDAFLIGFVPYVIMTTYHIKILNHLKHHEYCLSAASRKVQNDLNKILMAQAVIPVFFAFLPVGFHLLCVVADFDLVFATFIIGILYCWIPIGNAISVLLFVTVYRQKLMQLLFRPKPQITKIISFSENFSKKLLMAFWRTFHSVNEDIAFIFGLSLNAVLLFLVIKTEIKAMKKYNILLFQCCCIDLIQVVISFIVKPVVIIHKKSVYYLSNGLLRSTGGWIEMLGIDLWSYSVFFCINSMPVSFIFRYRTMCLDEEISRKFYMMSLSLAALSSSTYTLICWKFHYLDNRDKTYLAEERFPWLMADDQGKVKAASVCFAESFGMWLSIVDAFLICFVPYIIIIVYYTKIMKYFKHYSHCLSASSRRVQVDLNRVLLAQAIAPIFTAFLPMSIHFLSALTDFDLVFASFICGILYSWIPVGNAICILFFVTAYRDKLKQLVSLSNLRSLHFTPSSVMPTTNS